MSAPYRIEILSACLTYEDVFHMPNTYNCKSLSWICKRCCSYTLKLLLKSTIRINRLFHQHHILNQTPALLYMICISFSFKTLSIFSLNDWTKRQFRNLDKDSDSKSCPHFRFKIFVINIINTNKAASTTSQLLLNVWFCVTWVEIVVMATFCILGSSTFLQWVNAEVLI